MTAETYLEQMRETQKREDHVLTKHLGGYRSKEVDQYIQKMQQRLRTMEEMYQERFEEMRTSLLAITRERDTQLERANSLEQKIADLPKYYDQYLEEKGLVAISSEIHEMIQDIDIEDLSNLENMKAKLKALENENLASVSELKETRAALDETKNASKIIEQLKIQAQTQTEKNHQLQLLLDAQKQESDQALDKLETTKMISQTQMIQLVNEQSRYQSLELEYGLAQEKNHQLTRENEHLEAEIDRQKELWETQRRALIQQFKSIIGSQKQYTQQLQKSIASLANYMERVSETELPDAREVNKDTAPNITPIRR